MRRGLAWMGWIFFLLLLLVGVGLISLSIGAVKIPLREGILSILREKGSPEYAILFQVRLPRILLGFAVGGALAISGVILQGMFRNPLVEPYTLGISGGAALGVCLNLVGGGRTGIGYLSLPISGFLGAGGVILVVYFLGTRGGVMKLSRLLLIGVMISFVASSLIMLLMAVTRTEDLHGIIFWIMGSLEEPNQSLVRFMILASLLGLLIAYLFSKDLNALSLGEEEALHLGINVERIKKFLFLLASFLTGCCVSITGIIGFVGLVVPHMMRMMVGSDHRILLISSFLAGSAFLILCDTLARVVITPMELPVGVITGMLGGGIFIYALSRRASYSF